MDRIQEAEQLIDAAVELMTLEQLSQWRGVRAWIEAKPPTLEELGKVIIDRTLVERVVEVLTKACDEHNNMDGRCQNDELRICLTGLKEILNI